MTYFSLEKPFWPKSTWDLSLDTMLALQNVSVINDLKGIKGCRNRGKAVKKQQFGDKRGLSSFLRDALTNLILTSGNLGLQGLGVGLGFPARD